MWCHSRQFFLVGDSEPIRFVALLFNYSMESFMGMGAISILLNVLPNLRLVHYIYASTYTPNRVYLDGNMLSNISSQPDTSLQFRTDISRWKAGLVCPAFQQTYLIQSVDSILSWVSSSDPFIIMCPWNNSIQTSHTTSNSATITDIDIGFNTLNIHGRTNTGFAPVSIFLFTWD